MKSRLGFGLLEVLIVLAVIAILITSSFYAKSLQQQKTTVQVGTDALKQANDLKDKLDQQTKDQQSQTERVH